MEFKCIFAGFGGQGVISMGTLLTYAGMVADKHVLFFPSYGIAMRGGTANCTVVVADHLIASPVVDNPDVVVAMNIQSLDLFESKVATNGLILVNSGMAERKINRKDVKAVYLNASGIAQAAGDSRMANMAMLGGLLKVTGMFPVDAVEKAMPKAFSPKLHSLIGKNMEVLKSGFEQAEIES
jgi:2-oxoglutarate ferredoxin oxidoreductase subunit gamma